MTIWGWPITTVLLALGAAAALMALVGGGWTLIGRLWLWWGDHRRWEWPGEQQRAERRERQDMQRMEREVRTPPPFHRR